MRFAGLLVFVIAYMIMPELRRLGRSIDRLAMAQLIALAESENLSEKMKQRCRDLADEDQDRAGAGIFAVRYSAGTFVEPPRGETPLFYL